MTKTKGSTLHAGEWVEIRSKEEILRTLDSNGQLDGMPFMPEMLQFCGQKVQIYKRAHKTCDTVFPVRGRRVHRSVHLETRCDGSAHGGCQAGCLLFWKDRWLKPFNGDSLDALSAESHSKSTSSASAGGCGEGDLLKLAHKSIQGDGPSVYVCQATQLPYATTRLSWWDIRQYFEDYTSRNVGLRGIFSGWAYSMYYNLSQAGIGLGSSMRWMYNTVGRIWGGRIFPREAGCIGEGETTPSADLNLQPGELVRVKSHKEILSTVNVLSRNRGLLWDAELVPYCGGTYRVLKRVTKIIDERTGMMQEMKNPCIILDSVVCLGKYSGCRMFCPRSIYSFWREVWLERVGTQSSGHRGPEAPHP
jgi:hypothetical protein